MDYSEDLAIEKQPKMRCDWTIKSISYFLTGPKVSARFEEVEFNCVLLEKLVLKQLEQSAKIGGYKELDLIQEG